MQQTVAILGGGVGGLTAAHELAERGFKVRVYERKPVFGGKARSIPVPDSGKDGRKPLPGEHGFRFFPGFYKHVTDTMRRIPYGDRGNTYDNLAVATRVLLARAGQTEITWLARCPTSLDDFRAFLPGGRHSAELVDLVRFYVRGELDFDVQLVLEAADVPWCVSSRDPRGGAQLGRTSWLKCKEFDRDAGDAVFKARAVPPARGGGRDPSRSRMPDGKI